jgi:hypothetical protein
MAAKFFTGLPLDGPDPECVKGHGERVLAEVDPATAPRPSLDHSHRRRGGAVEVPVSIGRTQIVRRIPDRACSEDPLAAFTPSTSPR